MLGWGCLKVVLQSSTVCSVHVRLNLEICFERFPCTQKLSLKWWESTILRGTILQTVQIFNPFPPVKTKHFRQIMIHLIIRIIGDYFLCIGSCLGQQAIAGRIVNKEGSILPKHYVIYANCQLQEKHCRNM